MPVFTFLLSPLVIYIDLYVDSLLLEMIQVWTYGRVFKYIICITHNSFMELRLLWSLHKKISITPASIFKNVKDKVTTIWNFCEAI